MIASFYRLKRILLIFYFVTLQLYFSMRKNFSILYFILLHTQIEHSILHLSIEETHDGCLNGNAAGFLILGKHKAEMFEAARGKYPDESRFIATYHRPWFKLIFLTK